MRLSEESTDDNSQPDNHDDHRPAILDPRRQTFVQRQQIQSQAQPNDPADYRAFPIPLVLCYVRHVGSLSIGLMPRILLLSNHYSKWCAWDQQVSWAVESLPETAVGQALNM
jgi:hypothetical protein